MERRCEGTLRAGHFASRPCFGDPGWRVTANCSKPIERNIQSELRRQAENSAHAHRPPARPSRSQIIGSRQTALVARIPLCPAAPVRLCLRHAAKWYGLRKASAADRLCTFKKPFWRGFRTGICQIYQAGDFWRFFCRVSDLAKARRPLSFSRPTASGKTCWNMRITIDINIVK